MEEAKQGRWEYHGVKIALDNHDKPKDERKSGREDILKKKEVIAVEAKSKAKKSMKRSN